MPEIVPIPKYEKLYGITKKGKVFSYQNNRFLNVTNKDKTYGHPIVCLYKNGVGMVYSVKWLLRLCFEST